MPVYEAPPNAAADQDLEAAHRLLQVYAALADQGHHLLGSLLAGAAPRQWAHYPDDDAVDHESGYQWFYHSHAPEDRPAAQEHGHIHVFARRSLWEGCLDLPSERNLLPRASERSRAAGTAHLFAIGFDAKGIPTSLFTVAGSVTGDLTLSGATTVRLIEHMALATGHAGIDAVIAAVARLHRAEVQQLLAQRDMALLRRGLSGRGRRDVLSAVTIDIDGRLRALLG